MTAEIAIFNKYAIALAADSAVTVNNGQKEKVINSANKLFALSKFHPVGIMIYGNADYMGVPWETIIKMYRNKIGGKKYSHLKEYALDFIKYISENKSLYTEEYERFFILSKFNNYLKIILNGLQMKIEKEYNDEKPPTKEEVTGLLVNEVQFYVDQLSKLEFCTGFDRADVHNIIEKYCDEMKNIVDDLIHVPIDENVYNELYLIGAFVLTKDIYTEYSGIVIAGYGDEEIYPRLCQYDIEGFFENKLKYRLKDYNEIGYAEKQSLAYIMPFAQQEMVHLFMDGIDPELNNTLTGSLDDVFSDFSGIVNRVLEHKNIKKSFTAEEEKLINEAGKEIFKEVMNIFNEEQNNKYVTPVMNMVSMLPKDELASVADALVSITSLKRKVTMDTESVGGPIDVAVISKSDGFVWIKRKHYFKAELNHMFFENYMRGE